MMSRVAPQTSGGPFTNGSFELPGNLPPKSFIELLPGDTRLVGWKYEGSRLHYANDQGLGFGFPPPIDGAYHISFNPLDGPGGTKIHQTFDTLPGKDYAVTFFVGRLGTGPGEVSLTASVSSDTGVQLASFKAIPPLTGGYGTQQRFLFAAVSASTALAITDTSLVTKGVDVVLDAVDVSILPPTISAAQTANGLAAYYPMDSNANDAVGNGLNGVLFEVSPTTDRFGRPGAAMSFDASKRSYVDLGNPPSLRFFGDFTVTAWVKTSGGAAGNPRVFSYGADCGYELLTGDPSTSTRQFGVNLACVKFGTDAGFAEGEWHFVGARRSGSTSQIYVNGKFVTTNAVSAVPIFSSSLNLGRKSGIAPSETRTYWGGSIDEVRFYNRALSEAELDALYSASSVGPRFEVGFVRFSPTQGARLRVLNSVSGKLTIEASSNLQDWIPVQSFPGLQGQLDLIDATATNFTHRFYRTKVQ